MAWISTLEGNFAKGRMKEKLWLVRGQRSLLGAGREAGLALLVVCSVLLFLSLLGHDYKGVMFCHTVSWTQ